MGKHEKPKIIGTIGTAIFTAVNLAFMARGATQVLGISLEWGWLALVGFIAFSVLVYILIKGKNAEIKGFTESRPLLSVKEIRDIDRGRYVYTHVDIVNNPTIQTEDTIARKVIGHVDFYRSSDNKSLFGEMMAVWADLPELVKRKYGYPAESFLRKENQFDINPNLAPCALSLLLKYKDEDKCYAIKYDTFLIYQTNGRRNPDLALEPNDYVVKLRLLGTNTQKEFEFWFDLTNPGKDKQVQLTLREGKYAQIQ